MTTQTLRYIFWILITIPIFVLGVYFFGSILNSIYTRYKSEEKIRKEKENQIKKRREFEENYNRRRGGGIR